MFCIVWLFIAKFLMISVLLVVSIHISFYALAYTSEPASPQNYEFFFRNLAVYCVHKIEHLNHREITPSARFITERQY